MSGGPAGHSPEEEAAQLRSITEWVRTHVDYLPGTDPESLLLALVGEPVPAGGSREAKFVWDQKTREALGKKPWETVTAADILGEQRRALAGVSDTAEELVQISDRVHGFLR